MKTAQHNVSETYKSEVITNSEYADIIDLPHYTSKIRNKMPMRNRAVQFAPFAALTGLEDRLTQTVRNITERIENDTTLQYRLSEIIMECRTSETHHTDLDFSH